MGMAEALRDALRIAMRADSIVLFLLGEDIGVPGGFGGGFTVMLDLAEEFGRDRVIDTSISESSALRLGRRRPAPRRSKEVSLCDSLPLDLTPRRAIVPFSHGWSVRRQKWWCASSSSSSPARSSHREADLGSTLP